MGGDPPEHGNYEGPYLSVAWDFGEPEPVTPGRAGPSPATWALVPSLTLHALVLILLAWITVGRPINPRPARSIEVEIIDQQVFDDAFEVPPEVTVTTPLAVPTPIEELEAAPPTSADGLTEATDLFASRILADPQNRQVREALPQLENTERIIQLCNIEGLEQLHLARPEVLPDSISPHAFAPTILQGFTLSADGAAFRAARKWYGLRFSCTVSPDVTSVAAYRYAIGDPVPEAEWEGHDLIAEDESE
jgi:hypothetical protein